MILFDNRQKTSPCFPKDSRRGFTIIEIGVSLSLLCFCMVMLIQIKSTLVNEQLRLNTAENARLQLQNVWELLDECSTEDLVANKFSRTRIDQLVANTLPEGRVEFEVIPLVFRESTDLAKADASQSGPPNEAGVTVHLLRATLSWDDGARRERRSISLDRLLP